MNVELVFLLIYFTGVVVIGVSLARRSSTSRAGYLLGGRSLGAPVTALRLQSTSMSGYMFQGAGGLGYQQGYYSMWYALGDLGSGVVNLSVIGRRMRKLSQMLGSLTSIGYLENRYPSPTIRIVASAIAVFSLFFYVLAQLLAGGQGLSLVTGLDLNVALMIAIGIILIYTFLGGYLAVAYTGFLQAIVMILGMVWILVATVKHVGGLTAGHEALGAINENLLTMWGAEGQYLGQWGIIIGAVLVFAVGGMGWPHVTVGHMSMKRSSIARDASLYATLANLLFIPSAYLIGMMGLLIVPNLSNPEMAIMEIAYAVLPPFAVGLVMAAIMAAIMSTADALLLQTGTIVSHDIIARFFKRGMDERTAVRVSRYTILVIALVGLSFAIIRPPGVFEIVVFSTSVLGSAFAPVYVCAVWWKKANAPGALASMLAGAGGAIAAELLGLSDSIGLDPMLVGLGLSITAIVSVSLLTQKTHPVPPEIAEAVEETGRVRRIPANLAVMQDNALSTQRPVTVDTGREGPA